MLQLLQIMNYLFQSGWSADGIALEFCSLTNGEESLDEFLERIGVEFSPKMLPYLESALPKWRSALAVTKMRYE
jgi:hypothetical protein